MGYSKRNQGTPPKLINTVRSNGDAGSTGAPQDSQNNEPGARECHCSFGWTAVEIALFRGAHGGV